MFHRKIQLVGGSTYTISLPKNWVKKNNLSEGVELSIVENPDSSLNIATDLVEVFKKNSIELDINNYSNNFSQVLFGAYYLGFEEIIIFSSNGLSKESKSEIRKVLTFMSGTEIIFENDNKIILKVLLEKSKITINQILYRIVMLLDSSIDLIINSKINSNSINEIVLNENEIDRLFHLMTKLIYVSLINPNVLLSSNIKDISLVPAFFLISKKLENIGDNIELIFSELNKKDFSFSISKEVLKIFSSDLKKCLINFTKSKPIEIILDCKAKKTELDKKILSIKQPSLVFHLNLIMKYLIDIQEELTFINFYRKEFIK